MVDATNLRNFKPAGLFLSWQVPFLYLYNDENWQRWKHTDENFTLKHPPAVPFVNITLRFSSAWRKVEYRKVAAVQFHAHYIKRFH